jgi:hypothetical protein
MNLKKIISASSLPTIAINTKLLIATAFSRLFPKSETETPLCTVETVEEKFKTHLIALAKLSANPSYTDVDFQENWQSVKEFLIIVGISAGLKKDDIAPIITRSLDGIDPTGTPPFPYCHKQDYVQKIVFYANLLLKKLLKNDLEGIKSALNQYPISTNGQCLGGEMTSIQKAIGQLLDPISIWISAQLDRLMVGISMKEIKDGNQIHVASAIQIALGAPVDEVLRGDPHAYVQLAHLKEIEVAELVTTLSEELGDKLQKDFQELYMILSTKEKGTLSETERTMIDHNLVYKLILEFNTSVTKKPTSSDSEISLFEMSFEARTLSTAELQEEHTRFKEFSTVTFEDYKTGYTQKTLPEDEIQRLNAREYYYPSSNWKAQLDAFCQSHLQFAPQESTLVHADLPTYKQMCALKEQELSDSIDAICTVILNPKKYSLQTIYKALDLAVIYLEGMDFGHPDISAAMAKECLKIHTFKFPKDPYIQTKVMLLIKQILSKKTAYYLSLHHDGLDELDRLTDDELKVACSLAPTNHFLDRLFENRTVRAMQAFRSIIEDNEPSEYQLTRLLTPHRIDHLGVDNFASLLYLKCNDSQPLLFYALKKNYTTFISMLFSPEIIAKLPPEITVPLLTTGRVDDPQMSPLVFASNSNKFALIKTLLNRETIKAIGPENIVRILTVGGSGKNGLAPIDHLILYNCPNIFTALFNQDTFNALGIDLFVQLFSKGASNAPEFTLFHLLITDYNANFFDRLFSQSCIESIGIQTILSLFEIKDFTRYPSTAITLAGRTGNAKIFNKLFEKSTIKLLGKENVLKIMQADPDDIKIPAIIDQILNEEVLVDSKFAA